MIKYIKYIAPLFLLVALIGCNEKEENFDYLNNFPAPKDLNAVVVLAADNSGLVTVTPTAKGVQFFDIFFTAATTESVTVLVGESAQNTYEEGVYNLRIVGNGINGAKVEKIQELNVSFAPPSDLVVTITKDPAVARQVTVTATVVEANSFDVFFGENDGEIPVNIALEEEATYQYEAEGTYTIRVVAKGGAIQTTEYSEEVTVSGVLEPIAAAPSQPSRDAGDVISLFSDAYQDVLVDTWRTEWSQSDFEDVEVAGNRTKKYSNLSFVGIETLENPSVDASGMTYVHLDIWTPNMTEVRFKLLDIGADDNIATGDDTTEFDFIIPNIISTGMEAVKYYLRYVQTTPWHIE